MEEIERKYKYAIGLITIGIFITPFVLRNKILSSGFYPINILAWLGYFYTLLLSYRGKNNIFNLQFSKKKFVIVIWIYIALISISLIGNSSIYGIEDIIKFYIATILPTIVLFIKIKPISIIPKALEIWVKILNCSIIFIIICGLIDVFLGNYASLFFSNLYDIESLYSMLNQNRMVSYMGHSLDTAQVFIIYFISNYVYTTYFNKRNNKNIYIIISYLGVALTGSKLNMIVLMVITLALNFKVKKIRNNIIIILAIYCLYCLGVFDNFIYRLQLGIASGDLSTGRNVELANLYKSGELSFNMFLGHSEVMSESMIIALEYPLLRLAFRYGIIFSIFIGVLIFIYPCVILIKRKQIDILICLLGLIISVNNQDSIAGIADGMLIFCSTVFIILNISQYLFKGGKELKSNCKRCKEG